MSEDVNIEDVGSSPTMPVVSEPVNPVLAEAVKSKDFGAFQAEKRAARVAEMTGRERPTDAGADPAKPVAQATSDDTADAKPASDPPKMGRGKEKRIPQLDADIQDRLRRRAEIAQEIAREEGRLEALKASRVPKPDETAAVSSPATPDGRPTLAFFEADPAKYPDPYTAYIEALADWKADQVYQRKETERQQREAGEKAQAAYTERITTFRERISAAVTADAEVLETLDPRIVALKPLSQLKPGEDANALNALAEEFIKSDDPIGLMRYFSDHPEEVVRVGKLDPPAFFQAIGRITAKLEPSPAAERAATTKTAAPPPPTTLGQRASESGDPLVRAVRDRDTGRFLSIKRQQRLRAAGG
jgi:hypothetical protein